MKNFRNVFCIVVLISFLFHRCESDDEVNIDEIIAEVEFSKNEILSNGTDLVNVKVIFNQDIKIDKVKLDVEVDNGTFIGSKSNKIKDIVAERDLDNTLFTELSLQSSTINKEYNLKFKVQQYIQEETLKSICSKPVAIKISSSAVSVFTNFDSEVLLEGFLSNEAGGKVSNGVQVEFFDFFQDGTPVGGKFRNLKPTSNSESKVSVNYSPGLITPNQFITIKVLIVDNDSPMEITDDLEIFVNEND